MGYALVFLAGVYCGLTIMALCIVAARADHPTRKDGR